MVMQNTVMKNMATVMPETPQTPCTPGKEPKGEKPYGALLGSAEPQSTVKEGKHYSKAKTASSPENARKSPAASEKSGERSLDRSPHLSESPSPVLKTKQYLDQIQQYNFTKTILLDGEVNMLIELAGTDPEETGRLRGITRTGWFSNTVSTFILINAITLAIETDQPSGDPSGVLNLIENICCGVFSVEMVLKIIEDDIKYFQDKRNVFDFILAWYTIIDVWVAQGGFNLSFLRMLRVLRIARLIKVLRIFRELWLILVGMAQSCKVIFWSSFLLFFCTFTASIVATQLIGRNQDDYGYDDDETVLAELAEDWNNYEYFGSIRRSMVTLFNMGTGLEWLEIIRPVQEKQPYLIPFFIMYMGLISWGIMNAIIGVIVEGMMQVVKQQDDERHQAERKRKERLLDSLMQKAMNIDGDQDGEIDETEMHGIFDDPEFKSILGSMRVFQDTQDFISIFDRGDGNGRLTYNEFVRGMYNWIEDPGDWKFCELKIGESNVKSMLRRGFQTLNKRLDNALCQQQVAMQNTFKEMETTKQATPSTVCSTPPADWSTALESISQTLVALQGSMAGLNANVEALKDDTVDMKKDIGGLKHDFNYLCDKVKRSKDKDKVPKAQKKEDAAPVLEVCDPAPHMSPAPHI